MGNVLWLLEQPRRASLEHSNSASSVRSKTAKSLGIALALLVGSGVGAAARYPAKARFEVASIRPNISGAAYSGLRPRPGGTFIATNATLDALIRWAYAPLLGRVVRPEFLIGGPSWIRNARFDVQAKATADVPLGEMLEMVQALLEERFGLGIAKRLLERDVYVMSQARKDGRLGPELRAAPGCADRPSIASAFEAGPDGKRRADAGEILDRAAPTLAPTARLPAGANRSASWCVTTAGLIDSLSRSLGAIVVNETKLEGHWQYMLTWAGIQSPPTSEAPSFFTAVEDQLGLKLERKRRSVEVLVVDRVHTLIEN